MAADVNLACTLQNVFWGYYIILMWKFVSANSKQLCTFIRQHWEMLDTYRIGFELFHTDLLMCLT